MASKREASPRALEAEGPVPKRARLEEWYVRVAKLRPAAQGKRYGERECVAVADFLKGKHHLRQYSLIIPAFTRQGNIPSRERNQRADAALWGSYEHVRYFGLLDLDMDLGAVVSGAESLFDNVPAQVYKDKSDAKRAFAERLVQEGTTFGSLLASCTAFRDLYDAVCALQRSLVTHGVRHSVYFSGGGGFRVLFHAPGAWRRVVWGTAYAAAFYEHELRPLLGHLAPTLDAAVLDRIMAATDKNVYDSDKGTKPDLLAHFDTQVYPRTVNESFEASRPSRNAHDVRLYETIVAFWTDIFRQAVDGRETAALLAAEQEKPILYLHKSPLWDFPKYKRATGKATHFSLQGDTSSYRAVDPPFIDDLYHGMAAYHQAGRLLNINEIRTPVTRHVLDYDGGPPLLEPLQRADGEVETPLHALQYIHRECILHASQGYPGLMLTCPPRAESKGARAHLIWPDWPVLLEQEPGILDVLREGMKLRWPHVDWEHCIESPATLRTLFSDKLDRRTGRPEGRAMRFETAFDAAGLPVDLSAICPEAARPGLTPIEHDVLLLHQCGLRLERVDRPALSAETLARCATRTTSFFSARAKNKSNMGDLEADQRAAVMATVERALDDIKRRHEKPKVQLYPEGLRISEQYRTVAVGLLNHHQCAPDTLHSNNNVKLVLYMDRNAWELHCFKPKCPRQYSAAPGWGTGSVDTSALRAAWPSGDAQQEHNTHTAGEEGVDDDDDDDGDNAAPTPTLAPPTEPARRVALKLLDLADRLTRRTGSTACSFTAAMLHEVRTDPLPKGWTIDSVGGLDVVVRALRFLHPSRVLRVYSQARGLVLATTHAGSDAREKESETQQKLLQPRCRCVVISPEDMVQRHDLHLLLQEMEKFIQEDPAWRSQMTVVVDDDVYSEARLLAWERLLTERWGRERRPLYVKLSQVRDKVPKKQRAILLVDMAHSMGTARLRELVGLAAERMVLVGCPLVAPMQPGAGLADYYSNVPSLRDMSNEAWRELAKVLFRTGKWSGRLQVVTATLAAALEGVVKDAVPGFAPVFCEEQCGGWKGQTSEWYTLGKTHPALKAAVRPVKLPALFYHGQHEETTIVLQESALRTLTRAEWVQLLVCARGDVLVVRRPPTEGEPLLLPPRLWVMMREAVFRRRLLAGTYAGNV